MSETFSVKINGGEEKQFKAASSMYLYAALQAVLSDGSLVPLPGSEATAIHVEIWCAKLLPEYGPYNYLVWENPEWSGHIYCVTAVRKDK